jgi:Mg2+ and Co2+ transporter CorA
LDHLVDHYLLIFDWMQDQIDETEEDAIAPHQELLRKVSEKTRITESPQNHRSAA